MDGKTSSGLGVACAQGGDFDSGSRSQHGLTVAEVDGWQDQFLRATENGLRRRPKDEDALKEEHIKKLKQKIGDLVVENDVLREALKPYPLGREMSDA